jgi:hypothetical protein
MGRSRARAWLRPPAFSFVTHGAEDLGSALDGKFRGLVRAVVADDDGGPGVDAHEAVTQGLLILVRSCLGTSVLITALPP